MRQKIRNNFIHNHSDYNSSSDMNYALTDWASECGQSYANELFVSMVVYAGRKAADLFMNECFMNKLSVDCPYHQW